MKVVVTLLFLALFQSCCSQETTAPSPTPQPTNSSNDPSPAVTASPLPPGQPQNGPSSSQPPSGQPANPPNPTPTPEQLERNRVSLLEVVDAVVRHGFRAECFQKFNAPEVGEKFQKTLQDCLNNRNKSARPLSELTEEENKRHAAAMEFIKKNTGGVFLLIRISVEMARHAQKLARIFASHVVSEIQRRVVMNTVECSLSIFEVLYDNVDNNVELVKQCLIAAPAGKT